MLPSALRARLHRYMPAGQLGTIKQPTLCAISRRANRAGRPRKNDAPVPSTQWQNSRPAAVRAAAAVGASGPCQTEGDGAVVCDDLSALLEVLPPHLGALLVDHPNRGDLLEVVLDLGRRPEARFLHGQGQFLGAHEITRADLEAAEAAVGAFGTDNRAGITGTLHRISALRNRRGGIVGLTCRIGRAVTGHCDMIHDILEAPDSVLFLGRPGVGKTTVIREMARVLADDLKRRVVIIDTSNEIGGDGDIPHPAIGGARRMQVPDASKQHAVMIEAVENHMPQVVIVDEIGTEAEALACRTIAQRGVQLIATAHGRFIENLIKNPSLADLIGGVQSVTLGDDEANRRGSQKSILERRAPPTFPVVVEMRERAVWVAHWTEDSVDALLQDRVPVVQLRSRDSIGGVSKQELKYDTVEHSILSQMAAKAQRHKGSSTAAPARGAPTETSNNIVPAPLAARAASGNAVGGVSSDVLESLAAAMAEAARPGGAGAADGDDALSHSARSLKDMSEKEALQELEVLRYLGGQGGVLRTRLGSSFVSAYVGAGAAAPAAAASKKKKVVKRR